MIQETEREAEQIAHRQARKERTEWRGPLATLVQTVVLFLNFMRVTWLISRLARQAGWHQAELNEVDIPVVGLPPELSGLRIGHISDLHIGQHFRPDDARQAFELLSQAAPDLITITGDFVDHYPRDVVPMARLLTDLCAPYGIYGVFGNHDHRVGHRRLLTALAEHAPQVRILINDALRLPLPTGELWLAGIDSTYLRRADAVTALATVPVGARCLLLSHEPDAVDRLPRPVLLAMAGHSHGGQIRFRGRPLLLPPLGRRYHSGLNQSRRGPVFTSRGIGWTGFPLRFACPAEVAILRLIPAEVEA